jgi:dTDP-4-amino-4,6-dideoxygalactose transaminase
MSDSIPFAAPFIGTEEEAAVLRVLRSGWLTTGAETLAFEREFSTFLGGDTLQALAVNSATSGLHLALDACGICRGDVVLVPSYTFTSTAEVVRYRGAEVAFVDCTAGTFQMDPARLADTIDRLIRGQPAYGLRGGPVGAPKAVMPVHYGGLCCDMASIMALARQYHLWVIEDAAHAFPARTHDGLWAGTVGDVGVFSFYATKTITTGEGGMVVTRDPAFAKRVGIMRSHGIDRSIWNRYTDAKAAWYYEVIEAGYKYNIPDVLSAIGRVQLGRATDLLTMRQHIAGMYDDAFAGDKRFLVPPTDAGDARHLYPLRLHNPAWRNNLIDVLKSAGIGVSVHFIPLHIMPYYKKQYQLVEDDFPESYRNFTREISLPVWPGMTDAQVKRVIEAVKNNTP